MAKRRTQVDRREEAEARLVEAAIELVALKGYDGFTLSDVGKRAGYSHGLPVHYFGLKDNLLSVAAAQVVKNFEKYRQLLNPDTRGLEKLVELAETYLKSFDNEPIRMRALHVTVGAAITHPDLHDVIEELDDGSMRTLAAEIAYGHEIGNVRPDVDPDRGSEILLSILRGTVSLRLLDETVDLDRVSCELDRWLRAALAPD